MSENDKRLDEAFDIIRTVIADADKKAEERLLIHINRCFPPSQNSLEQQTADTQK